MQLLVESGMKLKRAHVGDLCVRCNIVVDCANWRKERSKLSPGRPYRPSLCQTSCALASAAAQIVTLHKPSFGDGCYTDTGVRVWVPLPRLKQPVYRAETSAVVR
eukprot:5847964-Amphidinium_carterae.1